MLGILLIILAILGLLVLAVVILLLIILLLVMIYPVSYRLWWEKSAENMLVKAKASWLLGLLKVNFEYPSPGTVIVKLLGFTVFDSGKEVKPARKAKKAEKGKPATDKDDKTDSMKAKDVGDDSMTATDAGDGSMKAKDADISAGQPDDSMEQAYTGQADGCHSDKADSNDNNGFVARIRNLIHTIKEKIRQIFEKIKNIRELAEYYLNLIKEEDTSLLFSKILTGSGKIIKSIRPRKIKGQLLLGTGSPDTTGYAMAVYGILSPYLGQNLVLTPDFEDKVFTGRLYVKGRIIAGILLIHGLKIALDRRLHSFIKKLKREVI